MNWWEIDLSAQWTFLNQNTAPTDDGSYDEDASLQCGPTCVAMMATAIRKVHPTPDAIKDYILGQSATGPTDNAELAAFLSRIYSIPTVDLAIAGENDYFYYVWLYLDHGKPLLSLDSLNGFNHWECIIGLDPTHIYVANPWNGQRQARTYAAHFALWRDVLLGSSVAVP